MKKGIKIGFVVAIFIISILGISIVIYAKKNDVSYLKLAKIRHSEILSQQENDYFIIYYMEGCPDCAEVEAEVCNFASNKKVYAVSYEENKEVILHYNWKEHRATYDKDIGKIINGKKIFYDGESEEKYKESNVINEINKRVRYEILIADDAYLSRNPSAVESHIYASVLTPVIDYSLYDDASEVTIAGYPTLLHIQNGKITEFYYDVQEIKSYIIQE